MMLPCGLRARKIVLAFWVMAAIAVAAWATFGAGWDVTVYQAAIRSLAAGHDPYADAIAKQTAYHNQVVLHPDVDVEKPFNYVYSPITLPLLAMIGRIPHGISGSIYWIAYAVGAFAILWVGMHAVEDEERTWLCYFAPVAIFFPGLLENGTVLSGNISYIVYGLVLLAAMIGWKKGRWRWFYLAVFAASCFKAPYLTLLAIPVLSQRKQWIPAGLTAGSGLMLLAAQPMIWPGLFRIFLQAIEFQLLTFRDFGSSPAGIVAGYLFDNRLYSPRWVMVAYLLYAVPLAVSLLYLSSKFLRGDFPLTRWIPVQILGVMLLSPRIQEYDLAVATIPMALIVWRLFPVLREEPRTKAWILALFFVINFAALQSWITWKNIACSTLVSLFCFGARQLLRPKQELPSHRETAGKLAILTPTG